MPEPSPAPEKPLPRWGPHNPYPDEVVGYSASDHPNHIKYAGTAPHYGWMTEADRLKELEDAANDDGPPWPEEIEFTDKFPGFYMDKLVFGKKWEKRLAENRLCNVYSNQYLMKQIREYPNVFEILASTVKEFKEDGMPCHMENMMALLGDTRFEDFGPIIGPILVNSAGINPPYEPPLNGT